MGIVFGADPDAPQKEYDEEGTGNGDGQVWYNRNVWPLMSHFLYHPRGALWGSRRPDLKQRNALARGIKRLLEVYPPEAIKVAMDRFFTTKTSATHPQPTFAFLSKDLQNILFRDIDLKPVEGGDDIIEWITNGFERTPDMALPWDGEFDREVGLEFVMAPLYNVLLRTYPDIVAEVLRHWWHGNEWYDVMDQACKQYEFLLGMEDKPSPVLKLMSSKFTVPRDFRVSSEMRPTMNTVADAVRFSRRG